MRSFGISDKGLRRIAKAVKGQVDDEDIRYIVGWGGSSPDTWDEYDTLEGAKEACWELAESDESLSDEERESLDEWGYGPEMGWGVCPENEDGGHGARIVAQRWNGRSWVDYRGEEDFDEYETHVEYVIQRKTKEGNDVTREWWTGDDWSDEDTDAEWYKDEVEAEEMAAELGGEVIGYDV
jgi:hypothetical protein